MTGDERETWVDAARACAVILVVVFHFLLWTHQDLTAGTSALNTAWDRAQGFLGRLRMPVLMAISGYLAASAIGRGWHGIRMRLAANFWLYLVWLTVYFAVTVGLLEISSMHSMRGGVPSLSSYMANLLEPSTPLWFIAAMGVFPAVLWMLRLLRVPHWLVIALATAIWAIGTYTPLAAVNGKFSRTFIFFAIGYCAATIVPRRKSLPIAYTPVAILTFLAGAIILRQIFDASLGAFLSALLAIGMTAVAAPKLLSSGPIARGLAHVGRRTIEIYVLHVPILGAMSIVLANAAWVGPLADSVIGDLALTVGLPSITICLALVLGKPLRLVPGLLQFPESWKQRLNRAR